MADPQELTLRDVNGESKQNGVHAGASESAVGGLAGRLTKAEPYRNLSLSAQSIHADDYLSTHEQSVAPPMHLSTTFRYAKNPDDLVTHDNCNPVNRDHSHIYSRHTAPNTARMEAVLTSILHGPALTYSSGLSAFHALLVFLNPKRVAIRGGYHGCHGVIALMNKVNGLQKLDLDCADEELQKGDVIHVETPINPTGESVDLAFYAEKARRVGAYLTVDATFGPPPLQDPFTIPGVDMVMHSGTKYFGGHSDMLCGVLAVAPHRQDWLAGMMDERLVLGSVMGSMEGWLGVRSLRTLELRVKRQSADAEKLVAWLAEEAAREGSAASKTVALIQHSSLQKEALGKDGWLTKQMPGGFGPVFAVTFRAERYARRLPSKLRLFHHATSLGGVETLIEWRAMSDDSVDRSLVRISVGIEGFEDLRDDLLQGLEALINEDQAA